MPAVFENISAEMRAAPEVPYFVECAKHLLAASPGAKACLKTLF